MEILKLEKKHLKKQVDLLNEKVYTLENPSLYKNNKGLGVSVDKLTHDANKAMEKYTEKLKREGLKHAKQKQGKG